MQKSKLIPLKLSNIPKNNMVDTMMQTAMAQNGNIETKLLESGFTPTDKILTRDNNGQVVCHYIKARDTFGRPNYIELDCDQTSGFGFIDVTSNDPILSQTTEANVIPYSVKMGSFVANKEDVSGVGFECDGSVCIMTRKDSSLDPSEINFYNKDADVNHIPVPFPVVKFTEILENPLGVRKSVGVTHNRMRNIAFDSCSKEISHLKENAIELQKQIERFEELANERSKILTSTMEELEKMYLAYEKGRDDEKNIEKVERDEANMKSIKFNLTKRNDLTLDNIALCHSMKERSIKIAALKDEIKALNDFAENLFAGIEYVLTE